MEKERHLKTCSEEGRSDVSKGMGKWSTDSTKALRSLATLLWSYGADPLSHKIVRVRNVEMRKSQQRR